MKSSYDHNFNIYTYFGKIILVKISNNRRKRKEDIYTYKLINLICSDQKIISNDKNFPFINITSR